MLVLVLWALVLLTLVASGLTFELRQELVISNMTRGRLVAHYLARAGVERALAELYDDTDATDSLSDTWADDENAFGDVELTGGTFSVLRDGYEPTPQAWYGANDESAKLNLNSATLEQLQRLPNMTDTIASAIIDWRDGDEVALEAGTERGYYLSQAHPYNIRNDAFRTTRELLLVRNVTPELFYGEDTNGNGLLDENENDGDTSAPPDNADGRLDRGWFAYVTVYSYEKNVNAAGEKRLNVNSASADQLGLRLGLESWAAESIVKARESQKFEHLIDLLNVTRPEDVERNSQEADAFVRSADEQDRPVTLSIFKEIVDDITLQDEETIPGRVNVNTAPRAVLKTLPGVDDTLADAIVHARGTTGFNSIAELLNVHGLDQTKFGQLEPLVTVRAYVFRIYSVGAADGELGRATIECIADRGGDVPRVLYWQESTP